MGRRRFVLAIASICPDMAWRIDRPRSALALGGAATSLGSPPLTSRCQPTPAMEMCPWQTFRGQWVVLYFSPKTLPRAVP